MSDQIRHNLINLNLLCWKGWKPTLYEGLLTAEQKGITLYPHLYGDCTWLESVEPEHPSAMLASVSSHVGRSVGRSFDFQSPEKPDFPQQEQEFLHEGHGFSRHEHGFSRETLMHEPLSMIGGSAVGQLPCDSAGVQMVGQLPARVVELLQSSAVGEPRQDHRLCQDVSGTLSTASPATSSGPGPAQQSALCISSESLRGMSSESLLGMSSESLLGMSVGRSVGRSGGCAGVGFAVSQCAESPDLHETPWPKFPPDTLGHHCCDAPGHQVEAQSAEGGGSHLRSAVDFGPLGSRVEHGGGICRDFFPRIPCPVPEGEWSTMLPLDHGQREWQKYCHLCSKGATPAHLATDAHNKGITNWKHQGCPQLVITPEKFTDTQRLEMTLQAYLPDFTKEQVLVVKERVLQEEWYRSSNRSKYEGPIPSEVEEVMVASSSAAPSGSATPALTRAGGIWTEPPPPPPEPKAGGTWTKPPPPPPEPRRTSQRAMSAGATMEEATVEHPKKKPRRRTIGRTSGKPWPDTYGVALRSSALLQNARPLDPLTPRSTSPPQMVSSSDSDDQWGVWRAAGTRHQDASGSQRPKTPPKASGALGSKAKASEALGSKAPETPPKLLVAPLTPPRPTSEPPLPPPRPTSEPLLPPPRPASAPLPPPTEAPGVPYAWTAATYPSGRAIYSSPSGESYFTRERMGLVGAQERELWEQARLRTAAASRSVWPRRTLPEPPAAPKMTPQGPAEPEMTPQGFSGNSCSTSDQLSDSWIRSNTTSASRPEDGFGTSALEKPSGLCGPSSRDSFRVFDSPFCAL